MSASESAHLDLVAVTAGGVRLYFTTAAVTASNPGVAAGRPQGLTLVHVRLPPGFAPTSFPTAGRPSKVHGFS